MVSLEEFAEEKLRRLAQQGLKREIQVTERTADGGAIRDGRAMISFCCNDYLSFSHHPRVKQAAKDAIDKFGAGAGASRLITGNHPLIRDLEQRLARLKGTEDACVFSSGYLANIGIIPTFIGRNDIIFLDEFAHACLHAGSQLAHARCVRFHHNDTAHLRTLIARHRGDHRNALIVTDGVFSMDGDLAPLDQLAALARENDCWLMSDDAHGLGVIGGGRGSRHMFDPLPDIPLQMGTLSKAIGSFGGYLCAARPVINLVKTRARSLIYTTALPPASVAAALAALDIIETDPAYCAQPMDNARLFAACLDLPPPDSPIVPLVIGDTAATMAHASALEEDGFLVTGIRPPTVPPGTARLRFTFTARHRAADIRALAAAVRRRGIAPS